MNTYVSLKNSYISIIRVCWEYINISIDKAGKNNAPILLMMRRKCILEKNFFTKLHQFLWYILYIWTNISIPLWKTKVSCIKSLVIHFLGGGGNVYDVPLCTPLMIHYVFLQMWMIKWLQIRDGQTKLVIEVLRT